MAKDKVKVKSKGKANKMSDLKYMHYNGLQISRKLVKLWKLPK